MVQEIAISWIDSYEWKARVPPTLVILTPVIIGIFSVKIALINDILTNPVSIPFIFIIVIVAAYICSYPIRYFGKQLEKSLWSNWDGPPSTRYIRWRDGTYNDEIKSQIHDQISNLLGITLKTREEEIRDPQNADLLIAQAVRRIISFLYKNDRTGIWNKTNEEYGFLRNLLGNRTIFAIISISCSYISFIEVLQNFYVSQILLFFLNLGIFLISIICGWWIFPQLIKHVAERYADSLLMDFLNFKCNIS
jgi:hypothetical protein